jgi:hypothetical protein
MDSELTSSKLSRKNCRIFIKYYYCVDSVECFDFRLVILWLVGFGRACAPVRCAHPSFWALCHAQRGAARPSAHRSFAAPPQTKKNYFQKQNVSLQAQTRAARGIFSHWAKLGPTELRCTLVSYAAPSWALLYPAKLQYAAFKWAMLHPIWSSLHLKNYATPSELCCTLLS